VSYLAKNFAYSTLASPITNVDTSLTVSAGHGNRFPAITAPDYTKVVIDDGSGNREVIHVTARTLGSDVFTTIVRAQEGTTARNWAAGVSVELRQTADLVQTAMGHPAATSAAHAATAISNTPAGNIAATTVQAAINELDAECVRTVNGVSPTAGNVDVVSLKNYIINGGCVVAQRGNRSAVKDTWTYGGSDRTCVNIGGTTASGTIQRYAVAASASGYAQGISVTTTGIGAVFFQQRIESFNALSLNGKTVTVSALVYQNTGASQTAQLVIGKPTTTADVFSAQTALGTSSGFTIPSGTPTRISYTLALGAADASLGLYAQIGYSSIGAVTAKDFWITDFQLEPGAVVTPMEILPLPMERSLCEWYFLAIPASAFGGVSYSTVGGQYAHAMTYAYPTKMRNAGAVTNPTWSLTNAAAPTAWLSSASSLSYYTLSVGIGGVVSFSTSETLVDSEL
jgi:hypothetical protein